ncbi:hypothetical protein WA026_007895 [Henosepilachna vigintioctopunctata]|uniref:Zinc finger PHD-type domain-containing protein n=1 Tax=Henosepilachna vigintioctopunctata TaxID=420089 RepID=A0AAW1TVB0_9CUCU
MANCFHCEIEIKKREKWMLKCFICGLISHLKCANVSEAEHNVITSNPSINYTCKTCSKAKFFIELKEVKTALDDVKKTIEQQQIKFGEQIILLQESINKSNKTNDTLLINSNSNLKGYSKAVKRQNEKIIVKPTKGQDSKKTREEITEKIKPEDLAIGVENIKYVKNGGILINCTENNSKEKMKNKMEEFGDKYQIEEPKVRKPNIMLVNVEKEYIERENDEIEKCLGEQNCSLQGENKNEIKILRKYVKKKY